MDQTTVVLPRPRSRPGSRTSLAYRRTVSMTAGAEAPLRALRDAPPTAAVLCHPCDEAIVRHLVMHADRHDCAVQVDANVTPGVLALSVRLAVAS
jgi:hypothetical protein